ncbi:hypothetical protein G4O51_12390 [Candidatus Bathyarchaeota archaeon A05DMB-2]|nr:hypothetical protein [Candidatus Bathyarchaeota archaeon A05DMB-2]
MSNEEFQRRLAVLNMRVQNVNLAFNDLLREISDVLKAYADRVAELEKKDEKTTGREKK